MDRAYLCIDLKCFYASVECVDRGRDPFEHRLVVADPSRGRKTICLAISPAMKELGVRNRCRVFEIPDGIDYEMARPRMRRYMEVSADIYARYLRYFSPEDIHVYSVDEVFIDVTPYLALYGKTPRELAVELVDMVRRETGICATAGIGTNLFLAKVALDVTAKHAPDNIGELDEERYKCLIWPHRPITDIWGIGPGIARRLAQMGAHDMGGVALLSEQALYDEFGVNAELLIDHAWGVEPCTMAQIHAYRPKAHSMGSGQVLMRDYSFEEARVVLREMVDNLALELVDKGLVCGHIALFVGYAHERGPAGEKGAAPETFTGEHGTRVVGRRGEGANASRKLAEATSSRAALTAAFLALYAEIVDPNRAVRRVNIAVGELVPEEYVELTLFSDPAADTAEKSLARAEMAVKRRFGKNALLRGTSYRPAATGRERNEQVGGHHE
ncbi:DNA repair protein [Olsenella sp. DSM 107455]|uniref:DNA repair protein n=1 Tax=Thermophilibacter gallinarum TaxID=2779357 RepID=A0ABR9QR13_9ACTN|nr:DNA repair protein [Thermophilibacter gallinarum]MBE5023523.1 DNA repair protein [Thermophilibacter gallinarum]